jgi:hypothetical protein
LTDIEVTESNNRFSFVELFLWYIKQRIKELYHAVAIFTSTQQMSCIDLSRDTDYAYWGYSWFTSVPPDRILSALPRAAMQYIISCNPVICSYAV